jgi:hypothetical protein
MNKTIFKCFSKDDSENDSLIINSKCIKRIKTVSLPNNILKLQIEYYDEEFCINTTFFCDEIVPI